MEVCVERVTDTFSPSVTVAPLREKEALAAVVGSEKREKIKETTKNGSSKIFFKLTNLFFI